MCTVQHSTLEILSAGAFSDVGVFHSALGGPCLMGQLSALCSPAHKVLDSPLKDTHTHTHTHTCTHAYKHVHLAECGAGTHTFVHSLLVLALDFSLGFLEIPASSQHSPLQKVVYFKFILLSMLEYKYSKYTMDHVLVAY